MDYTKLDNFVDKMVVEFLKFTPEEQTEVLLYVMMSFDTKMRKYKDCDNINLPPEK